MLGKKVDLGWLDTGTFEHIRGSMDGWRTAKVLIIEFWASYVHHLAFPAASRARTDTETPSAQEARSGYDARGWKPLAACGRERAGSPGWSL